MDSLLTISCPSCSRQLRLPPAAQGKKVKCPVCQTIFQVDSEESPNPPPAADPPAVHPAAITPRLPPELPPATADAGEQDNADDRPRPRRLDDDDDDRPSRRRDYDDDDTPRRRSGYDDDDDYDDERAYRRRERRIENATASVAGPAIAIIVLGFLEVAVALFVLVLLIAIPAQDRDDRGVKTLFAVFCLIGFCWAVLMLIGAFMMKSMKSYPMAMMASIMALVPFSVFHLGVGIWAIVVLCDTEVKRAFARNER